MANYYGTARTNYFKVKDNVEFEKALEPIPGIDYELNKKTNEYCIWGDNSDSGTFPSFIEDEETEEYIDFDISEFVSNYLADDEVAIFMEGGAEKLRYIVGYAIAVNNKGERRRVSLNDIYDLAKDLTNRPDDISFAEY